MGSKALPITSCPRLVSNLKRMFIFFSVITNVAENCDPTQIGELIKLKRDIHKIINGALSSYLSYKLSP